MSLLSIGEISLPGSLPGVNSSALSVSIECCDSVSCELILKILQTNSDVLKRDPLVYATVVSEHSLDLKTLVQKHIKQLSVESHFIQNGPQATLSVSGEFPFCPHFTHFTAKNYQICDSVPAAFMKAVKEGKFPNLRRIELICCTMNDYEWPEVPEFSCKLRTFTMSDLSQIQKLFLKLTELTVWEIRESLHLDRLFPVRLENLSVLHLSFHETAGLQSLDNVLKQGLLPNLSALTLEGIPIKLDLVFREFDLNHTARLETLALRLFTISAEEVEILSEKLTDIRLTELDLTHSVGFTGRLSALFTHSFPTLNTLILSHCKLNANDLQSLARANVEGKLPQLRHLDITGYDDVEVGYLFTHSTQWNQLTVLKTSDVNILNTKPEFLTSLEELCVPQQLYQKPLLHVTRCWSGLKTIELLDEIHHIADCVERGMFPDLKIASVWCDIGTAFDKLPLFKLFKANIVVMLKRW